MTALFVVADVREVYDLFDLWTLVVVGFHVFLVAGPFRP